MTIERSMEADAFLATIDSAPPEAVSACEGWTTHEIARPRHRHRSGGYSSSGAVSARGTGTQDPPFRRTGGPTASSRKLGPLEAARFRGNADAGSRRRGARS